MGFRATFFAYRHEGSFFVPGTVCGHAHATIPEGVACAKAMLAGRPAGATALVCQTVEGAHNPLPAARLVMTARGVRAS